MPFTGAVASVSEGATTLAVTGSFATPYQVGGGPSWVTGWSVGSKTTTGFTITFAVPAPAGATFDWTVVSASTVGGAGGTVTLTAYLAELRRILRDPDDVIWSQTDKTAYLNDAIQRRDLDSGQNRVLLTKTLTTGTALYDFTTIGNPSVFDVIAITLIYGNTRTVLNNYSYTELTTLARTWTTFQSWPLAWARYGPSQVYLAPTPSSTFSSEWDCSVYSDPLVSGTDADPLPYPYTSPVPYYAAYKAKLNERQMDEAEQYLTLYQQHLNVANNARAGMVPTMYGSGGLIRV
jgi:hypothetical protein